MLTLLCCAVLVRLLEEAGICTIPGSGFGQAAGSNHFRTT